MAESGGSERRFRSKATRSESEWLSQLVGSIYDAALDPALWPSVLEEVCTFVSGCMANLFSQDVVNQTANRYFTWGDDPHYTALYLEKLAKQNPLFPKGLSYPVGQVFTSEDIIPHTELRRTAFYKKYMEPQGYLDSVVLNLEKTATSVAMLAVIRHRSNGFVDSEARRRLALIGPHVRRAVLIGKLIDLKRIETAAFAEAIDQLATGVFLVNSGGELVHANASGEAILEARDPFELVGRQLTVNDERLQRNLRDTFAATTRGDAEIESAGTALPLLARSGEHYVAHVLPLTAGVRRRAGVDYSAVAAVFVRRATIDLSGAIAAATLLYGFTPAEERVLRALIEVGGLAPVAAMLGIGKRTATTHLEHIFHKTGTRRQAELVKLIAGFNNPTRKAQGRAHA